MQSRRTLVCVMAHPDDDAYGIAGTVALHGDDPGLRFVLVHATNGGAGEIREGFPATRETLGAIRMEECRAAWRAHGRVPDRHEWLGYPDGELDKLSFDEISSRVETILAEEEPTVVATFGPSLRYHMRGVPDDQISITIDIHTVAKRIVAGLLEHRSQHHVIIDDPTDVDRWERIVTREWWTIAWPPRPPDAPMLTDMFEALTQ